MVTTLHRKLARDLRRLWGQVASIAAVVACGVMTVVTMRGASDALRASRDAWYAHSRFADVFVSMTRAPASIVRRVEEIHGVHRAEDRVVREAALDVPGLAQTATGRLVSLPDSGADAPMNALHLRRGRYPFAGTRDEALVSERFAEANGLVIGDSLGVMLAGKWRWMRLAGIALSPEFVYEVGTASIFGDERLFGVLWLPRGTLESAYDLDGATNDLLIALAPGADLDAVMTEVDTLLAPYGGRGAVARADQLSASIVEDELHQLAVLGTAIPAIFLGVAAFLLAIVLSRLVATQREEIAVLKAFGYSDGAVGRHFLGYAAVSVVIGGVLGAIGGAWLADLYTDLYAQFFRFPVLEVPRRWPLAFGAAAVCGVAALGGALGAVRAAVRLPPAEAMRPEAPARFRPLILERLGLVALLPTVPRMVLRHLERRPFRAALAALGIGLAASLIVVSLGLMDSMDRLMEIQFGRAQREDVTVTFASTRAGRVRWELARLDGVRTVELVRVVPARLRHHEHEEVTVVTGLSAGATLRQLVTRQGDVVPLPAGGLVISRSLATKLEVTAGHDVDATFIENGRSRRVPVVRVLDELVGSSAYAETGTLHEWLREDARATGALLAVERGAEPRVLEELKGAAAIGGSTSRAAMLAAFRELMLRHVQIGTTLTTVFAAVIAIGVVYNGARITLSERARELASLRVLGFTRRETSRMLLGEQWAITAVGIPLGFLLGLLLFWLMARAFETDLLRLPVVLHAQTLAMAALVVGAATAGAGRLLRQRVYGLDLIAVLKTRE